MYYVFATRERELFSSSPPLWSFRVTQSLFYFIPGCYFATEDAVYLIFGKIFGRIVLVYDDRNTVFCDYCCGKTAIDLNVFQLSGCHSDIPGSIQCRGHTGCGIAFLDLDFSSAVDFLICLLQFFHNRCYGRRSCNNNLSGCTV